MNTAQRAILAGQLGVTDKTVSNWLRHGMPEDLQAAIVWKAAHVNPHPRKGGKLPGAGRPRGARDKEPRQRAKAAQRQSGRGSGKAEVVLDRAARLALLASGKGLTKAQIDLTLDETRVIDAVRASELEAGRLVDAEQASEALAQLLQSHKGDLDGLPQRLEAAAVKALRLTQAQARQLRDLASDEVLEVTKRLMASEWRKKK